MKKLLLVALMAANVSVFAQTTETVSVGAQYANDVYYSFANGVAKTEARDNWHIAFTTKIVDASVWTNEGLGVELYIASSNTSDWSTLDTTGMTWTPLHNSPNTWVEGAFNDGAGTHPDYGWGTYNNITHNVLASKIFVMKLPSGVYKKIIIDAMLTNGDFEFRIANLDGTGLVSKVLSKTPYASKNFFYYDVVNDVVVDREPAKTDWDILFSRYMEEVIPGSYYPVTGVYINQNVTAAKAAGDTTMVDWNNFPQTDSITVIGSNWKSFNNSTFQWNLDDSLSFFVTAQDGNLYKMIFKDFGGSSTGNIVFSQSIASAMAVAENNAIAGFKAYPNPAQDFLNIQVESDGNASVEIFNINGQLIISDLLTAEVNRMNISSIVPGVYLLRVSQNGKTSFSRIVVQ